MLLLVSAGVWHCVECMQYHYVCTIYSICTIVLCNMFVLLCKMLVLWAAVVAYRIQMSFCTLFHVIALCKSSPCWECIVELSNMALISITFHPALYMLTPGGPFVGHLYPGFLQYIPNSPWASISPNGNMTY